MGETIVAKVDARGRVQLSKALIEALNIESGDLVRITVEKIISVKSESGNPLRAAEFALA
ncbi:MAG: hypothetical protein ACE14P_06515 [Methanotrichaceae archaeon]